MLAKKLQAEADAFYSASSLNQDSDSDDSDDDYDCPTDAQLERQAREEEEDGKDPIDEIGLVEDMIELARIRAEQGDQPDSTTYAHKFSNDAIDEYKKEVLSGLGGPEKSLEAAKEQLKLHERLDELYRTNKLKPDCLGHYLNASRNARKRWLPQLNLLSAQPGLRREDFTMPASRLAKIPAGWSILADKGFVDCGPFYPNLNHHFTPYFLEGRSQFDRDEISEDRRKCQLRYTSETVFSRVTNFKALRDRVPYGFFSHLNDIHSLALGMANLCEPFYLSTDGYFSELMASRSSKAAQKKNARQNRRVAELRRQLDEAQLPPVAGEEVVDEGGVEVRSAPTERSWCSRRLLNLFFFCRRSAGHFNQLLLEQFNHLLCLIVILRLLRRLILLGD
mmetsp:Transcript_33508/g.67613  ORF Transcript_33508/g.67613 Transcript_33508/m.67613 type:complete len:393 (-) Transcript_33508:1234-2412(-)